MRSRSLSALIACLSALCLAARVHAMESCDRVLNPPFGMLLHAVPTPHGKAPAIDGRFDDWDLGGLLPVWAEAASAPQKSAQIALMYDASALYVAAHVSLPGRAYFNAGDKDDGYQTGDLVQMRLVSDPKLPYPPQPDDTTFRASHQVFHWSAYRNSKVGETHMTMKTGPYDIYAFSDKPAGSAIAIVPRKDDYVLEARIPWSVMNVPGGRCPFGPGRNMTAIVEVSWDAGMRAVTSYRKQDEPGDSVWWAPDTWGQIAFESAGWQGTGRASALAGEGDHALFAGKTAEAARLYAQAQQALTAGETDAHRAAVGVRYLWSLLASPDAQARARALAAAEKVVASRAASPDWGLYQLTVAGRVLEDKCDWSDADPQVRAARQMGTGMKAGARDLAALEFAANRVLAQQRARQLVKLMADAAKASAEGRHSDAAALYEQAAAASHSTLFTTKVATSAARLAATSRMLAASAPNDETARVALFLGTDHSVGSRWRGLYGREAWVLYAFQAADLCGGPRLLDKSFSYRAWMTDPGNKVRRWRDGAGFRLRPQADLALEDPACPGDRGIAFLDDNGEDYPRHCGPDLFVDLTIPAGAHILAMPLHFSQPEEPDARYGVHILSAADDKGQRKRLASTVVAAADGAGYLRARVVGPLKCTLLVQRLNSQNTNIQALFLDPDPLGKDQAPLLSAAFSDAEIAAAKADKDSGLTALVAHYQAVEGAEAPGWPECAALLNEASPLLDKAAAPASARAMTAWMAWQVAERMPYGAGLREPAFERYVSLRYPVEQANVDSTRKAVEGLRALAADLRKQGRLSLARIADSRASEADELLFVVTAPTEQGAWLKAREELVKRLWSQGTEPYLAIEAAWLWEGEGSAAPRPLELALDAGYAAGRLKRMVEAEVGGSTARFEDAGALQARMRIDTLFGGEFVKPREAPSDEKAPKDKPAGPQRQPIEAILYAAACEPLLRCARPPAPADSAWSAQWRLVALPADRRAQAADSAAPAPDTRPCLLAPHQLDRLADALLARRMFAVPERDADVAVAAVLLKQLASSEPRYGGIANVKARLASLTNPPAEKK